MVLVTGATGFVGQALLRRLLAEGHSVGCLLRPSSQPRKFPPGAVHIATGTLQDLPALRAAMQGVGTIIHLVGAWRPEGDYDSEWINQRGTANLVEAAQDAKVKHIIYLSHIHADQNSAFTLLRSKGTAEAALRHSGIPYTILRSSLIFGPGDHFTTVLAMLIKALPFVFPVTGDGRTRFQPIHVDDVAACLAGCLDSYALENVTLPIGGQQHLSYAEVLDSVMEAMRVRRMRVYLRMPFMRSLVHLSELLLPHPLVTSEQLDLFSIDNTTDLGNVPRNFGFLPRLFTETLSYLHRKGWRRDFVRYAFKNQRARPHA